MAATNNVAILTASTTMIDDEGAVFISVFGKLFDFTNKMYKGIINPKQCRSFGFQCVEDTTDHTSKFEFYSKNVFLTLHMQRSNFLEDSFCPSENELPQFSWAFMSDETS